MALECNIEFRATSADAIQALSELQRNGVPPLPMSARGEVLDFKLKPGLHETVANLLIAIKWSDLAYGAAGSLIATAIVSAIAKVLRHDVTDTVDLTARSSSQPATARIELSDRRSVLRIELTGMEAEETAKVIREMIANGDS